MALERVTVVDYIGVVVETGGIEVRRSQWLVEDGQRVQRLEGYVRAAYAPDQDLSHEEPIVQALAAVVRSGGVS